MPFSSGTFSLVYSWSTEAATPPIAISKLDEQHVDIAAGLSNCLLRDGTGLPTATQNWNGQRLSNLGAATARTDAIRLAQVQDFSGQSIGSVAGTDTITGTLTPAITAYAAPMVLAFEPANTNTGAVTINLNSVGAVAIVKWDGDALVAGDLVQNVPALIVYDGTQFVLINPQRTFQAGGIPTSLLADAAVTLAKLENRAEATVIGRAAGAGTGVPVALSAAQLVAIITTADGAGSGLDADTLDGSSSAAFAAASHSHNSSDITTTIVPNSGALTIGASHVENIVVQNDAATITVNDSSASAFTAGDSVVVRRNTSGTVQFAVAQAQSIESPGSRLTIPEENGKACLTYEGSNVWSLSGV